MKSVIKRMYLVTIVLSSTQIITLPFIGLSIFQMFLILTFIMSIIGLATMRKIRITSIGISLAAIWTISSIIAYTTSTYPQWARSSCLVGLMTSFFFFFMPIYFEPRDSDSIQKALIRSQYITILLSLYSYYLFYFAEGIPLTINLPLGMSIVLDRAFILRAMASGQIRLALPYGTPPILSGVMGICIAILVTNKKLYPNHYRITLICMFAIILLFTGSRTGYVAVFFFVALYFLNSKKKRFSSKTIFAGIEGILVAISIFIWKNDYVRLFLGRLNIQSILRDRHFILLEDAFRIWIGSFRNFFIGIGFGSSINMNDMKAGTAPYFFNFFVTTIVERGILGLTLSSLMIYITFNSIRTYRKSRNDSYRALYAAIITGMVGALFYEMLTCYFVVIVLSTWLIINKTELNERGVNNIYD